MFDRFYTNSCYLWVIPEIITIVIMTPFGWAVVAGSLLYAWVCARWIEQAQQRHPVSVEVLRYAVVAASVGAMATVVDAATGIEPKLSFWFLPLVGGVLIGLLTAWWRRRAIDGVMQSMEIDGVGRD